MRRYNHRFLTFSTFTSIRFRIIYRPCHYFVFFQNWNDEHLNPLEIFISIDLEVDTFHPHHHQEVKFLGNLRQRLSSTTGQSFTTVWEYVKPGIESHIDQWWDLINLVETLIMQRSTKIHPIKNCECRHQAYKGKRDENLTF